MKETKVTINDSKLRIIMIMFNSCNLQVCIVHAMCSRQNIVATDIDAAADVVPVSYHRVILKGA